MNATGQPTHLYQSGNESHVDDGQKLVWFDGNERPTPAKSPNCQAAATLPSPGLSPKPSSADAKAQQLPVRPPDSKTIEVIDLTSD